MNPTSLRQSAVDSQNIAFWDEMCGTNLARSLGIKDHSPQSLAKFDVWFFNFYHYLLPYIPLEGLASKDVLEVGLGYGSVAQKLAGAGCRFHGLDIAAGPVALAAKRMEQCGYDGVVSGREASLSLHTRRNHSIGLSPSDACTIPATSPPPSGGCIPC